MIYVIYELKKWHSKPSVIGNDGIKNKQNRD